MFIHGFIGTLDIAEVVGHFSRDVALAPSLLGYGEYAQVAQAAITLADQAAHIADAAHERFGDTPVHVVGHSVGGAIAALLADRHPRRVASLISVEGNFTLRDAFWSASVGKMGEAEADAMLAGFVADPEGWLVRAGVEPNPGNRAVAERWLADQPASTLRAMGRSVVETTGDPAYTAMLRSIFQRCPVHLVAGALSRDDWDVPDWATRGAASNHLLPGCGHLMMLQDPDSFARVISDIVMGRRGEPYLDAVTR